MASIQKKSSQYEQGGGAHTHIEYIKIQRNYKKVVVAIIIIIHLLCTKKLKNYAEGSVKGFWEGKVLYQVLKKYIGQEKNYT